MQDSSVRLSTHPPPQMRNEKVLYRSRPGLCTSEKAQNLDYLHDALKTLIVLEHCREPRSIVSVARD